MLAGKGLGGRSLAVTLSEVPQTRRDMFGRTTIYLPWRRWHMGTHKPPPRATTRASAHPSWMIRSTYPSSRLALQRNPPHKPHRLSHPPACLHPTHPGRAHQHFLRPAPHQSPIRLRPSRSSAQIGSSLPSTTACTRITGPLAFSTPSPAAAAVPNLRAALASSKRPAVGGRSVYISSPLHSQRPHRHSSNFSNSLISFISSDRKLLLRDAPQAASLLHVLPLRGSATDRDVSSAESTIFLNYVGEEFPGS